MFSILEKLSLQNKFILTIPITLILSVFFLKLAIYPYLFLSTNLIIFLFVFNFLICFELKRFQILILMLILLEIFFFRFLGLIDRTILFNHESFGYLEFGGIHHLVLIDSVINGFIWANILTASFLLGILLALIGNKFNTQTVKLKFQEANQKHVTGFVIITIVFLLLTGLGFLSWGEDARWNEEAGFQEIFLKSFIPISMVFLLKSISSISYLYKRFLIYITIIIILLLTFFSGIRTTLLYAAIPLFIFYLFPINFRKLVVISIAGVFVVIAFLIQEAGRSYLSAYGIDEISYFLTWYFENSFDVGGVINVIRITGEFNSHIDIDSLFFQKWSTGTVEFGYGLTFLKPLFYIIPSGIWPDKPIGYSVQMARMIFPDVPHMSMGSGIIGEFHYNFGPIAPLFLLFFSYYFTKLVIRAYNIKFKLNDFTTLIMISFIPLVIDFYRSPFSDSFLVLCISIFTLLLLKTFNLRSIKL